MRKHKKTNLTKLLQPIVSAACVWALLLGLILPVAATETVSTEADGIKPETESTAAPTESELVLHLRSEAASYIETYGLTPDMPDQVLADIYTALDGEKAYAAWNKLNELLALAEGLTQDEADALSAEENTKLCQRFYNIMAQINMPMVLAETTGPFYPCDGIKVTVSGTIASGSWNDPEVTVSVKATSSHGSCDGTKYTANTATITVANIGDKTATVSFAWTATDVNNLKIDGTEYTEGSGSFSKLLDADVSIEIKVTTGENDTENKLVMSQFLWEEAKDSSKVSLEYDSSLGSVSVAGSPVTSGFEQDVSRTDGIAVAATPANGAAFLGWIDKADGTILSSNASDTLKPTKDMSVGAIFYKSGSNAWFQVGAGHMFATLTEATAYASSSADKVIIPMYDGTLPSGDYTIPSGVTLLIPYNDTNTLHTTSPAVAISGGFLSTTAAEYEKPTAYRTLTMLSGANIAVDGAISLSGTQCAYQKYNGLPTGPTSFITMNSGSSITVNNGANLYAWGYITGSGKITIKSGGKVYEDFQVKDWRGGSAASGMIGKSQRVFPVSQYYVQNIEVPMTLENGAKEYGYYSFVASKNGFQTEVPFIGEGSMFVIGEGGSITKDYLEDSDRLRIDVNGNLTMSALVLSVTGYNMNSKDYVLPITNNMSIYINSGTTSLSQDMALLPGSEIVIASGAQLNIAENVSLFIYDTDEWLTKQFVYSLTDYSPLDYANKGKPATRAALADAKITVNGTMDASTASIYTTSGGANICSDGGGVIKTKAGDASITYQATQSGTTITFVEIPITPAQLKNADGIYVSTAGASSATTYSYIDGVWQNCKRLDIVATNIAVNAGLDMWFYVKKADVAANGSPNYEAVITKEFADDRTDNPVIVTIPDDDWVAHTDNGVEYLRFCFSDISAKEMTDNITAVIYQADDDVQVSNTYVQTVQKYAIETLDAFRNKTDQKSEYLKKALMDMLEYGASAQAQFKNYNIDLPANIAPKGVTTLADHAQYITTNDQDPKWEDVKHYENGTHTVAGVTASATNTLMFTFYFDIPLPEEQAFPDMYAVYEYTSHAAPGQPATVVSKEVKGENFHDRIPQSLYGVDVTTLSIVDGHQPITCTLYNADGSVAAVATDSIGGYAMRNKDNGAIFRDMMQFVDSALAYFDYQS